MLRCINTTTTTYHPYDAPHTTSYRHACIIIIPYLVRTSVYYVQLYLVQIHIYYLVLTITDNYSLYVRLVQLYKVRWKIKINNCRLKLIDCPWFYVYFVCCPLSMRCVVHYCSRRSVRYVRVNLVRVAKKLLIII